MKLPLRARHDLDAFGMGLTVGAEALLTVTVMEADEVPAVFVTVTVKCRTVVAATSGAAKVAVAVLAPARGPANVRGGLGPGERQRVAPWRCRSGSPRTRTDRPVGSGVGDGAHRRVDRDGHRRGMVPALFVAVKVKCRIVVAATVGCCEGCGRRGGAREGDLRDIRRCLGPRERGGRVPGGAAGQRHAGAGGDHLVRADAGDGRGGGVGAGRGRQNRAMGSAGAR